MAPRKILVTGGAGYIGAHTVVELVKAGYEPVIIDNLSRSDETLLSGIRKLTDRNYTFAKGDCTDAIFLNTVFRNHGPFVAVIHFAALKSVGESVKNPVEYYFNNIVSLTSLLQVMRDFEVRDLIFSSSCTVYGEPDQIPVSETAPIKRAESPYGATKQMGERILEDAAKIGFRAISLRYFNPIGAHPSALIGELPIGVPNNLVPYITQTAIGKRDELVVFGNDYNTPDGSCIRDYIHVVDLAKAHVKAMEYLTKVTTSEYYQAFNLGLGVGVSVLELVHKFISISGIQLKYRIGPRRPGDVEKTYANPGKANDLLQWRAELSIEDALRDAWRWEQVLSNKTA